MLYCYRHYYAHISVTEFSRPIFQELVERIVVIEIRKAIRQFAETVRKHNCVSRCIGMGRSPHAIHFRERATTCRVGLYRKRNARQNRQHMQRSRIAKFVCHRAEMDFFDEMVTLQALNK